jgi:hypothetical protein
MIREKRTVTHVSRTVATAILKIIVASLAAAQVPAPSWTAGAVAAAPQSVRLFVGEVHVIELDGPAERALGKTLVIAMTPRGRVTFVVEVIGRPADPVKVLSVDEIELARSPMSGSLTTSYSPALTGTHAAIRQRVEFRHEFGQDRTLRVSGELTKYFYRTAFEPSGSVSPSLGFNRLSAGMTSSAGLGQRARYQRPVGF